MKNVVLLFAQGVPGDSRVADVLEGALSEAGYAVQVDRRLKISVEWARSVEEKIRRADAVVALVSSRSSSSEMFGYEVEIAIDAKLRNPKMRLATVAIGESVPASLLGGSPTTGWQSTADTAIVIADILELLQADRDPADDRPGVSPTSGGGVSADSPFYVERPADQNLNTFLDAVEPTILIQGARQTGKTSLIARGLKLVREQGYRACVTDFQRMGSALHAAEGDFYRQLAGDLARQMWTEYDLDWNWAWEDMYGPTSNLDEFVRSMVAARADRLVWFMDEADCLFSSTFAESFFALVRSWHNVRALNPSSVWARFTVVIAYATEAHLFIPDINQSPFNVGRKIDLSGFTLRQMEELNRRYGEPLRGIDQVMVLHELLDGQPYLSRIAFDTLVQSKGNLRGLLAAADQDDGPFGDHLRRVLVSVTQFSRVRDAVRRALSNEFVETSPDIQRLISSGIFVANSAGNHVFRCKLYRNYLARHLASPVKK